MCKSIIKNYILIALTFFALNIKAADKITLDNLDAVLKKSGSLNAFLESKPLQQEYLDLASEYYGHNFTLEERQKSYWIIIDQMKTAVKKNPALGQKLWSTKDLGTSFQVDANISQRGVNLKSFEYKDAWKKYSDQEASKIEQKNSADREKYINQESKKLAEWIEEQKSDIERDYKNSDLPRSKKESARGQAYAQLQKKVLGEDSFQKLKSNLVLELTQKEAFGDVLNTGDANIVLDYLEKFRSKSANMFGIKGLESTLETLHPYIIKSMPESLIKPEVPKLAVKGDKGASTDFFEVKTKEVKVRDADGKVISTKLIPEGSSGGQLELKAIPRRFHAVFKGIELGECVAGGSCANVSMERWAVPALEGSHHYYVEAGDQYKGWVSLFPGEIEGKKVSNIEFGSNILNQVSEHKGKVYPLYEHVMENLKNKMPEKTNKFLVGDSSAINNANVLPSVQASTAYAMGENIDLEYDDNKGVNKQTQFKHKDQSTLDFIANERASQNQTTMYSGKGGIIDVNQTDRKSTILNDNYLLNEKLRAEDEALLIDKIKTGDRAVFKYIAKPDNIHKEKLVDAVLAFLTDERYIIGKGGTIPILVDPINFKKKAVFDALTTKKYIGVYDVLKQALTPEHINNRRVLKAIEDYLSDEYTRKFSPHLIEDMYIKLAKKLDNKNILELFKKSLNAKEVPQLGLIELSKPNNVGQPGVLDVLKKHFGNNEYKYFDGILANNLLKSLDNPKVKEFVLNAAAAGNTNFLRLLGQEKFLKRDDVLDFFKDSIRKGSKASIMLLGRDQFIDLPGVIDALKDRLKMEHAQNLEPSAHYGLARYKNRPEVAEVLNVMKQHCVRASLEALIKKGP